MAGTSKEELQSIYFELADFKARAGQLPEAADCYALALYYARRVSNQPLADLCREQILACHPHHVAVRENNAPLFFAQLLMRYPAEECSAELARLKKERAAQPITQATPAEAQPKRFDYAHPAPSMMASHEAPPTIPANPAHPAHFGLPLDMPAPTRAPFSPKDMSPPPAPQAPWSNAGGVGTLDYPGIATDSPKGGLASLFGPATPKQAWSESVSLPLAEPGRSATRPTGSAIGHSGFENHHPFPQAAASSIAGSAQRMIDDFEVAPHPGRLERPSPIPAPSRNPWAWLEPLAGAVALAGIVVMGFFAYKVWPEVQKIDTRRVSQLVDQSFQEAFVWCKDHYQQWNSAAASIPSDQSPTVTQADEQQSAISGPERQASAISGADEQQSAISGPEQTVSVELPTIEPLAPVSSTESTKPDPQAAPLDLPAPRALPPIPSATTELPTNPSTEAPTEPAEPAGWTAPEPPPAAAPAPPAPVSALDPVLPPR
jgi:hypothetical protein